MKYFTKIIFFLLLLPRLSNAEELDDKEYIRIVERIDTEVADGKWEEAENSILQLIEQYPEHPGNILMASNLGMIQFYQGKDSVALNTLDALHSIAPASVVVLTNRARVKTATGDYRGAVNDYDMIAELDSLSEVPYVYRGMIYLSLGIMDRAAENIDKLKSLDSHTEEADATLAAFYMATVDPDEALVYFTRLIKSYPSSEYYAGRARCHLEKDNLIDAAEDIASGFEIDGNCAELYLCRALLNKKRYRREDALEDANRAIALGADREYVLEMIQ